MGTLGRAASPTSLPSLPIHVVRAQILGTSRRDFTDFADAAQAVAAKGRVAAVCSSDAVAGAASTHFRVLKPLEE